MTTSNVGLKNSHIRKNLSQNDGTPQIHLGMQRKKFLQHGVVEDIKR